MSAVFSYADNDPSADRQIAQLRIPPHSIEAESSVLGGLLLDNGAWDRMGDVVVDGDFYRHEHKLIYAAIGTLINASKPADVITVYEQLQNLGKAEEIGGLAYLNSLAQYVPSASNIRRYAEIVRERSILRKLVSASDEIATNAFNTQGKAVDKILDEAEQKIFNIGEEGSRMKQGFQGMDSLVVELLDRVTEMADNPNDITGVRTGFYEFDKMTSGLQPGDMIVLAARPSMGKTSLAINIAEHVALNEGLPVAVFSMEMGASQLAVRIVGSIGRIDQGHLRTGKLTDDEWPRLTEAIEKLRNVSLHIDETPGLTTSELRANARRLARQYGKLGLIVVDYLQLMSVSSSMNDENRATAVGEISRGLKMLAKELKCPVIALSQLSRGVESRTDKRPMMSDLRESGAIEQDADVIMFIYRDDYYDKNSKEPGVAEVIISKHRNGPTGHGQAGVPEAAHQVREPGRRQRRRFLTRCHGRRGIRRIFLQAAQHLGQRLAGLVAKALRQDLDVVDAIEPEGPKVLPQLAPGREGPDLAPIETAERPHDALARRAADIAVVHAQLVARLHRFAQGLQAGARAIVECSAGAKSARLSAETRAAGGSTERILPSADLDVARHRRIDPALRQPRRRDECRGFILREHQRRQVEARAQAVADAGFALDRHALALQVGHVAVDGALRHLEPLRQERGGREPPPADELDDLEQAVGAAHEGRSDADELASRNLRRSSAVRAAPPCGLRIRVGA